MQIRTCHVVSLSLGDEPHLGATSRRRQSAGLSWRHELVRSLPDADRWRTHCDRDHATPVAHRCRRIRQRRLSAHRCCWVTRRPWRGCRRDARHGGENTQCCRSRCGNLRVGQRHAHTKWGDVHHRLVVHDCCHRHIRCRHGARCSEKARGRGPERTLHHATRINGVRHRYSLGSGGRCTLPST